MLARISKYHLVISAAYAVVLALFFFLSPDPWAYFKFDESSFLWILLFLLLAFAGLLIANKFLRFGIITRNNVSPLKVLFITLFMTFLIALPEEIIFRGYIQENLQGLFPFWWLSVLVSAAVFGLAHMFNGARGLHPRYWNWKLVALAFVAGIFFGAAYTITGNLFVPVALHSILGISVKIFTVEVPVTKLA